MQNKIIRIISLFAALLLSPALANAAVGKTDTGIYLRPSFPPLFGADHKAVDPTFGSTILRVTGPVGSSAYDENSNAENLAPIQHFTGPWNKDGSHFLVWWDRTSNAGLFSRIRQYAFDGNSFTITGYKDMKGYDGVSAGGTMTAYLNINRYLTYSPIVPELVYGLAQPNNDKIASYNFETETGTVLSPQPSWLAMFGGYDLDALMVSDDENIFGFTVTSAVQVSKYYVVWVKSINAYATIDLTAATGGWLGTVPKPSSVFMSRDGRYIRVSGQHAPDTASKTYIYTVSYDSSTVTISGPTAYSAFGPDYFAGKMSTYRHYGVNEDAQQDGGFGYQLRYRDYADIVGTNSRIFTTPASVGSTEFCHPAVSQGGGYVSCGLVAYSLLSRYGANPWILDGGSVYARAITGSNVPASFDFFNYLQVSQTQVANKAGITGPGMYWYDTINHVLYAWVTGGGQPNDNYATGGRWQINTDELVVADVRNNVVDNGAPQYPYLRLMHMWGNFCPSCDGKSGRPQGGNSYDELPTALSWDNKYVLLYSNWGSGARHDVFVVNTGIGGTIDTTPPAAPTGLSVL